MRAAAWLGLAAAALASLPMAGSMAWADPPMMSEVVLPAPTDQTNHGAAIVGTAGGRLLACWYSGSSEANADSRILCSASQDSGRTWTAPSVAVERGEQAIGARAPNKSVGNVTLHHDGAGRLWMIYGVIQRWDWPVIGNLCRNWLCGRVDAKVSQDQGATWSPAVRLDDQVGALPRAKPLWVPGVGEVIPLYLEGAEQSFIRLVDLAETPAGSRPGGRIAALDRTGLIQPSLVVQADGRLRAFLRDSRQVAVHTAIFDPQSATWSEAVATTLPNPGSAVDAFADGTGQFVLAYNPSTSDRRTLRLAASADGVHFRQGCDLVPTGRQGEVAYPTVIRSSDGLWHVVYSSDGKTMIRHIVFNEEWLAACLNK